MATRILEYADKPLDDFPVVPARYKVTEQTAMTATGTSAQSSAFNARTRYVCVQSDEQIYTACGSNPTATANSYRIPAGGEQWFEIDPNESWKVAIRT